MLSRAGGDDILINYVGMATGGTPEALCESDPDRVFAVSYRSLLILTVGFGPAMIEQGGGSIINSSSVASLRGSVGRIACTATRGAIDAITCALAADWGPKGVRVNAVNPGIIVTAMSGKRLDANPGLADMLAAQLPLQRLGAPEDIADFGVFLASDAARYITGECNAVDGGMVHTRMSGAPAPTPGRQREFFGAGATPGKEAIHRFP